MTKPFEKDDPRINRAGRPKGSGKSEKIRTMVTQILEENLPDIRKELQNMKGKDKLVFIRDLLKYVIAPAQPGSLLDNMSDEDTEKLIAYLRKEVHFEA
jgi:hypothetical protein